MPTVTSRGYGTADTVTFAGLSGGDAGVRALRPSLGSRALGGHGAIPAFRHEVLHRRGRGDLVGNNIPVFFIQDGIKFPDVIHAGKPHPDRARSPGTERARHLLGLPSLHTEAQHHTLWNMSDRGIPRSYR